MCVSLCVGKNVYPNMSAYAIKENRGAMYCKLWRLSERGKGGGGEERFVGVHGEKGRG